MKEEMIIRSEISVSQCIYNNILLQEIILMCYVNISEHLYFFQECFC